MSGEALDEIQWKSPEFIQERGLHTGNVLEYFSLSPFYDRTSNNQVLMMQFQFQQIQIPVNLTFQQYFQSKLSEMTGTEFIIAFNREPDFWIIRKQKRIDLNNNILPIQDYYIIGANVYQAPKIYDILSSRLLSSILSLKNSFDLLNTMTQYHISDGGHSYNNAIHLSSSHNLMTGSSTNIPNLAPSTSSLLSKSTSLALPNSTNNPSVLTPNTTTPQTNLGLPIAAATNIPTSMAAVTNNPNNPNNNGGSFNNIEITSGAFDSLLNNIIANSDSLTNNTSNNIIITASGDSENSDLDQNGGSNTNGGSVGMATSSSSGATIPVADNESKSIYLDDIPLYGRGSTVEMLGLKLNVNNENDD
ncbi:MED6 mediator subfamily complex component-domain-containing protein [Scheffersomyces coipomensis]|uniref:MED6 mediator subfamily complex component-domain-containing protein n=1 Tax=Scheffersomyces coipomensis TaxID=1788519 RepID=UPI00315D7B9B